MAHDGHAGGVVHPLPHGRTHDKLEAVDGEAKDRRRDQSAIRGEAKQEEWRRKFPGFGAELGAGMRKQEPQLGGEKHVDGPTLRGFVLAAA